MSWHLSDAVTGAVHGLQSLIALKRDAFLANSSRLTGHQAEQLRAQPSPLEGLFGPALKPAFGAHQESTRADFFERAVASGSVPRGRGSFRGRGRGNRGGQSAQQDSAPAPAGSQPETAYSAWRGKGKRRRQRGGRGRGGAPDSSSRGGRQAPQWPAPACAGPAPPPHEAGALYRLLPAW